MVGTPVPIESSVSKKPRFEAVFGYNGSQTINAFQKKTPKTAGVGPFMRFKRTASNSGFLKRSLQRFSQPR
ncbi:unnamed protein product, partial [Rotaria magnacalcarata]